MEFKISAMLESSPMPHYISCHSIACMTRQQIGYLENLLRNQTRLKLYRLTGSQIEGKLLLEIEGDKREIIEQVFQSNNIHYDWLIRIEFENRWPQPSE